MGTNLRYELCKQPTRCRSMSGVLESSYRQVRVVVFQYFTSSSWVVRVCIILIPIIAWDIFVHYDFDRLY